MTVSQFIYGKIGFILLYKYILYFIRVSETYTDFPPVESGKCSCTYNVGGRWHTHKCFCTEMRWNLWGDDALSSIV